MNKCIVCDSSCNLLYNGLFDDRYGAPGYFSIYRCKKCGFGRTLPTIKRTEIGNLYKKYYQPSSLSVQDVERSKFIISKFFLLLMGVDNTAHRHINKGSDVLDVGSTQRIAKKLNLDVFKGFITDNPFPGKK